jgi:hypothetical protein
MSRAAKTMFYFAFYIVASSAALLLFPELILKLAGIPTEAAGLARMFGIVLAFLAIYYFTVSRYEEMRPFWRVTTYTRGSMFFIGLVLIYTGQAGWYLLPMVIIESASGLWTAWALKADSKAEPDDAALAAV